MLIACGFGILLGAMVGGVATIRKLMLPVFSSLYAVPIVILYPVFTAWFGIGSRIQDRFCRRLRPFPGAARRPRPASASSTSNISSPRAAWARACRSSSRASSFRRRSRPCWPGCGSAARSDHHRRRVRGNAHLGGRHRLSGDQEPHHARQPARLCRHHRHPGAGDRLRSAGMRFIERRTLVWQTAGRRDGGEPARRGRALPAPATA